MMLSFVPLLAALLISSLPALGEDSPFNLPERAVLPSPEREISLPFAAGEKNVDFEASPGGGEAVVALQSPSETSVFLWDLRSGIRSAIWKAPGGFSIKSVTWHPAERRIFVLGMQGNEHQIGSLDLAPGSSFRVIYRSHKPLRRLITGPRPFQAEKQNYRLFFGIQEGTGVYAIRSITEQGEREYQVAGPKGDKLPPVDPEFPPGTITAPSALPLSFHPGGHFLLWEDDRKLFHAAKYGRQSWEGSKPLLGGRLSGGTVTALPNGLGVLHWKPGTQGVNAIFVGRTEPLASGLALTGTPSILPDGRGLLGLTRDTGGRETLHFVPISLPLGDVTNAWMFAKDPGDLDRFAKEGGLFRALPDDQLYSLYESEFYHCGGYDNATPTRPYLVTTDIFWELVASAYEGLFILRERQEGIPKFWTFIAAAAQQPEKPGSRWGRVFKVLESVRDGKPASAEGERILRAEGSFSSEILGVDFNYGELKPRGHYTKSAASRAYFKAFRYFTEAARILNASELEGLPEDLRQKALAWIAAYEPLISGSRMPVVFKKGLAPLAAWIRYPAKSPGVFPLSFGFDNEILDSTVFHQDRPASEQITGSRGPRLLPSGLDLPAAMGSSMARKRLGPDLGEFPNLATALDNLQKRMPSGGSSIYDRWIEALGTQWADDVLATVPANARDLFATKRLQTGLASWTALRHATVLVNERTVAECGEGGFEELMLRPPRGAVEGDPKTFEATARLFDAMNSVVPGKTPQLKLPDEPWTEKREPLKEGIQKKLRETATKARAFALMAEKQRRGEPLSKAEYEDILFVGRVAEHNFLIFKSLSNEELALSNPDPMPKIADVAGGRQGIPYFHAAIGRPLEWDFVVPFFGRRQIVRGSVYSYFEVTAPSPLTDEDWRKKVDHAERPAWITRFLSSRGLECPPPDPF